MAAISPEKLNELMLKVRKGATASLTIAQLKAIIEAIGGKLEPIVGLVQLEGEEKESGSTEWSRVYPRTAEEANVLHKNLEKYVVTSLPSKPKAGLLYVTDLQEPEPDPYSEFTIRLHASG